MNLNEDTIPHNNSFELSPIDRRVILKLEELSKEFPGSPNLVNMYLGAIALVNSDNKYSNPDWKFQVAHSLREILYSLNYSEVKDKVITRLVLTKTDIGRFELECSKIFGLLTEMAHHFNGKPTKKYSFGEINIEVTNRNILDEDFELVVSYYKEILIKLVQNQIDIHDNLDVFFDKEISLEELNILYLSINENTDALRYFYTNFPLDKIDDLEGSAFFDDFSNKILHQEQSSRIKALGIILSRLHRRDGQQFCDVVLRLHSTQEEWFDKYLLYDIVTFTLSSSLNIFDKLFDKMQKEGWVRRLSKPHYFFNMYLFEGLFEKVKAIPNRKILNKCIDLIFTIDSTKEEILSIEDFTRYRSEILELIKSQEFNLSTFTVLLLKIKDVIRFYPELNDSNYFDFRYNINFFDIELSLKNDRDDSFEFLLAIFKTYLDIGLTSGDNHDQIIQILEEELKEHNGKPIVSEMLLYLYETTGQEEDLQDGIVSFFENIEDLNFNDGKRALDKVSSYKSIDKKDLFDKLYDLFLKKRQEVEDHQLDIISTQIWTVYEYFKHDLAQDVRSQIVSDFGEKPRYVSTSIESTRSMQGSVMGGFVEDRTPKDLSTKSLDEIITYLKTEAQPEIIAEKFKDDSFLSPRSSEGLGKHLREIAMNRREEFDTQIERFVDLEIDSLYSYEILWQYYQYGKEKKIQYSEGFVGKILNINEQLFTWYEEGKINLIESNNHWINVFRAIGNILEYCTDVLNKNDELYKRVIVIYRKVLIDVAEVFSGNNVSNIDLLTQAINKPSGIYFGSFVKLFQKRESIKKEEKEILSSISKTQDLPVRSQIGINLASIYFRDKEFAKDLLNDIFPKDDKELFLSTWTGYTMFNVFRDLFNELRGNYSHAITLLTEENARLIEKTGDHLALAYAFLDLEVEDELFLEATQNPLLRKQMVSFIGRAIFSNKNSTLKNLEERKINIDKFYTLWDFYLAQDYDVQSYTMFSYWVTEKNDILNKDEILKRIVQTIKKSEGQFGHGFQFVNAMQDLYDNNPEIVLNSIEAYIFTPDQKVYNHDQYTLAYENEFESILKKLYVNDEYKLRVEQIISALVEAYGERFWKYRDVLKNKN